MSKAQEEFVTLVDKNGVAASRPLPRAEAFANQDPDLYVPIAVAVVFNGLGEVLIQQRKKDRVDGGKIDLVCGVVASGEDPLETAARESLEETNVMPFDLMEIAAGINIYGRYRRLYLGLTERQGVTMRESNVEVEWATLIHPDYAQLLTNRYGAVGDFHNHLAFAQAQAFEESNVRIAA